MNWGAHCEAALKEVTELQICVCNSFYIWIMTNGLKLHMKYVVWNYSAQSEFISVTQWHILLYSHHLKFENVLVKNTVCIDGWLVGLLNTRHNVLTFSKMNHL